MNRSRSQSQPPIPTYLEQESIRDQNYISSNISFGYPLFSPSIFDQSLSNQGNHLNLNTMDRMNDFYPPSTTFNQSQSNFSPLDFYPNFQFNQPFSNDPNLMSEFGRNHSIYPYSMNNFYPSYLLQQQPSNQSYPPTSSKLIFPKLRRHSSSSFSNSTRQSSENSTSLSYSNLTHSLPTSILSKQIHCTVFDCFKPAFCTLEPCDCKLCNDHLGNVMRSKREFELDLFKESEKKNREEGEERVKKDLGGKIYKCAGCGLESFEDKKDSPSSVKEMSIKRENTKGEEEGAREGVTERQEKEEEEERKIFAVHFLPSSNIFAPLPPDSTCYNTSSTQSGNQSSVQDHPSHDFYQPQYLLNSANFNPQVSLIPLPPPPPFFDFYNYPSPFYYITSSPPVAQLEPFIRPTRRNINNIYSNSSTTRKPRSNSLPSIPADHSIPIVLNPITSASQNNQGLLNTNYRFPASPTSNSENTTAQTGLDSPHALSASIDTTSNSVVDAYTTSIQSPSLRQKANDLPLQPYHRANYQNRRSYSSSSNPSSHHHQSRYQNIQKQNEFERGQIQSTIEKKPFEPNPPQERIEGDSNREEIKFPVIKVENIPFETTISDMENWIIKDSLPPFEEVINPIHLILHRTTGRTLPHCFIEINSKEKALEILQTQDRSRLGDRTIRVKWERKEEMMRDLFSQSEYFQNNSSNRNLTLAACPLPTLSATFTVPTEDLLKEEDLKNLINCCKDLPSWRMKPIERPFLNIVSILSKWPWTSTVENKLEPIRDSLFDCAFEAMKIAAEKSENFPLYEPFEKKLRAAIDTCPGFTQDQKKESNDFVVVKAIIPTSTPPSITTIIQTPPYSPICRRHSFRGIGRGFEGERKFFSNGRPSFDHFNNYRFTQANSRTIAPLTSTQSSSTALTTPPTSPSPPRNKSYSRVEPSNKVK